MRELIKKITPSFLKKQYREYVKRKQVKPYKGDKVVCTICHSTFREFGPFGLVTRQNALCHNCGSLERHRLTWKYLQEKTDFFNPGKKTQLLHFAPEKALYDVFSENENIEYIPCDLFPEYYNYNGKVDIRTVDITNIPFEDNRFDVVLCNHVLEHIPDDKLAMRELYRVLKKGGWAILQVPIDYNRATTYEDFSIRTPEERLKAFGQSDHVRWYGRDYKDRLAEAGFKVTEDSYVKSFSSGDLFRYGLMASELIYYCKKE
ncbi:class I SAM-dependent methyltransferase [Foetidibacter luteolus]|uniref:class I SAM-dependent methyltransferase n=1 Tax=Foetidibacter luteolus TaxID=2608880 RepID=UPI00129AD131|nr:class I SAM-dependent methyltransferase [Foetidibacter luteolus]